MRWLAPRWNHSERITNGANDEPKRDFSLLSHTPLSNKRTDGTKTYHADKQSRLLRCTSDTGITDDTDGKTSGETGETDGETGTELDEAGVEGHGGGDWVGEIHNPRCGIIQDGG